MSTPRISQFAIRANAGALQRRITNLRVELALAESQLRALRERCPHTNKRNKTDDDIAGHECDDCGKSLTPRLPMEF